MMRELLDAVEEYEKSKETTNKSYIKERYDEYHDGEHVAHEEKEYKDGKLVKDEGFDKRLSSGAKNGSDASVLPAVEDLMKEKKELEEKLAKVEAELEREKKRNIDLSDENTRPRKTFKEVKHCLIFETY